MKTILVTVDFSDVTGRLIDTAQELASAMGSRVVLLHVRELTEGEFMPEFAGMAGYTPMPVMVAKPLGIERERLEALKRGSPYVGEMEALVVEGPTVSSIITASEEWQADLIVMGSHGHGAVYNLLVGSVTEGVLKATKCPVLVVPSENR